MAPDVTWITDQIGLIDNGLLGTDGFGATYVVKGDTVALIETGTSLTAPTILAGLAALGIERDAVTAILLTHIHMDHAGGAGELAPELPNADVWISSLSGQHLVDPTRLLPSVERAVGAMWPYYGTVTPLDPSRLRPAEEMRLDLGQGLVIESIPTPGHSPDHLAFWCARDGALWAGDAIGIVMATHQVACAVTPPPAFDLQAQYATFERLRGLPISLLLPSHYGLVSGDPRGHLDHMEELIRLLHRDVWEASQRGSDATERVLERVMTPATRVHPGAERVVYGTTVMSVVGMQRYVTRNPDVAPLE